MALQINACYNYQKTFQTIVGPVLKRHLGIPSMPFDVVHKFAYFSVSYFLYTVLLLITQHFLDSKRIVELEARKEGFHKN